MIGLVGAVSAQELPSARSKSGKTAPSTETLEQKKIRIATANKDKSNKKNKTEVREDLKRENAAVDKKLKKTK